MGNAHRGTGSFAIFGVILEVIVTSGDRVKTVRKKTRLGQAEFGELFGFKHTKIRDIECGKQKVTPEFARELEAKFGAPFSWVLNGETVGVTAPPTFAALLVDNVTWTAAAEELSEIVGCLDSKSMESVIVYARERKLLMLLRANI